MLNQRSRRDATRVIYEILMQATIGVTKTNIIFRTNLNHRLAERYTIFLVKKGLLKIERDNRSAQYFLTEKGDRLLRLLKEVEKELEDFYTMSLSTELIARSQSSRSHSSFGSERGRVPIEIQRAFLP